MSNIRTHNVSDDALIAQVVVNQTTKRSRPRRSQKVYRCQTGNQKPQNGKRHHLYKKINIFFYHNQINFIFFEATQVLDDVNETQKGYKQE